jgi:type IV secretion system protein VirB5
MSTFPNILLTPKRPEAEEYLRTEAAKLLTNGSLSIISVVLALGLLGMALWNIHLSRRIVAAKPIIVRVDNVGRAEAVNYQWSDDDTPKEPEMKYFLTQFVTGFYARNRHTVQDVYPASLYYLDTPLFDKVSREDRTSQWMAKFVNGSAMETSVNVTNVALDLHAAPYKAVVEAIKSTSGEGGLDERKTHVVVSIWFEVKPELVVKNPSLVKYNPLGFVIRSFREDLAFSE